MDRIDGLAIVGAGLLAAGIGLELGIGWHWPWPAR
jgi:hypothetical protein